MPQELVNLPTSPDPADLRVEIARKGVRQFIVAQRMGISEGQLSRYLTGRKPLTPELDAQIRAAIAEVAA